ncbi:MAG TPA: hypothetical protein VM580_13625 [Labilithrix sp.]|nr:hypothetical protein [Labilithrix sp.]
MRRVTLSGSTRGDTLADFFGGPVLGRMNAYRLAVAVLVLPARSCLEHVAEVTTPSLDGIEASSFWFEGARSGACVSFWFALSLDVRSVDRMRSLGER